MLPQELSCGFGDSCFLFVLRGECALVLYPLITAAMELALAGAARIGRGCACVSSPDRNLHLPW